MVRKFVNNALRGAKQRDFINLINELANANLAD
jgi:hypothetical protein